jgi:hypothetical protein
MKCQYIIWHRRDRTSRTTNTSALTYPRRRWNDAKITSFCVDKVKDISSWSDPVEAVEALEDDSGTAVAGAIPQMAGAVTDWEISDRSELNVLICAD